MLELRVPLAVASALHCLKLADKFCECQHNGVGLKRPALWLMAAAGLVVMFGSTYNGQFEDVEASDKMIRE